LIVTLENVEWSRAWNLFFWTHTRAVPAYDRRVIRYRRHKAIRAETFRSSELQPGDGIFTGGPVPLSADLAAAVRENGEFKRVSSDLFSNVNTDALEYAACLSVNQLELFFTRLTGTDAVIYRSVRSDRTQPWSVPLRVNAISGFVEAPALSPDGRSLYYHALRGSRFVVERVQRTIP
jgi:hypothetical protein